MWNALAGLVIGLAVTQAQGVFIVFVAHQLIGPLQLFVGDVAGERAEQRNPHQHPSAQDRADDPQQNRSQVSGHHRDVHRAVVSQPRPERRLDDSSAIQRERRQEIEQQQHQAQRVGDKQH